MRNLFLDKWPFFILSAFPLLGMRLTVWAIAFFTLSALVKGKFSLKQDVPTGFLFACVGLFLLIVIRSLIPEYNKESLSYIEVSFSLLVLPLAFFLKKEAFTEKDLSIATWIFVSCTAVLFTYGMSKSLLLVSAMEFTSEEKLTYHIRTFFEQTIGYHPTYASIISGIAILKLLNLFLSDAKNRLLTGSLMLLLLIILALLASRTPIAATLGSMIILTALKSRKVVPTIVMFATISISILVFYKSVPSFSSRFKEVSVVNAKIPDRESEDSFNLRVGIFQCGLDIIQKNWAWGVGTGNMNSQMKQCYDQVAAEVYKDRNFNTHNQLIDYWGRLGILGPLALAVIFLTATCSLWISKDWIGLCLVILFFGAMQTENLLVRQHGIVTFCYFLGLHIFAKRISGENPSQPRLE